MITARIGFVVAVLAASLAACGDPEQDAAGAEATPAPGTPVVRTDRTTVPVPDTAPVEPTMAPSDPDCTSDLRTLEVALEAYRAQTGAFPDDEATLVTEQYLRHEIATYDIVAGTGEVVRASGVPCDEPTDALEYATDVASEPMTADEIYADLGPDEVETLGGPECARELAEIAAAGREFLEREGRDPESLDELAGDLDVEIELWVFDAENETLLAAPGSGCVDLDTATGQSQDDACAADRKTLEVAREAYYAMLGPDAPEPDEADLLAEGLIREETDLYDLIDGEVVPVAGGPCA